MRLPVLRHDPTFQPEQLTDVAQRAVDELMREGESQNTRASYRSALRYWAAWYALRYGIEIALPVAPAAVLQFVVDHAQRSVSGTLRHELPEGIDQALVNGGFKGKSGPLALNTIVHRLAVLSKAHQLRDVKNPCQDPKVRGLLTMTRRAYGKRGELPDKKQALTREPLVVVLETCDDSLRGKRDRALLLFAWSSGGRRRSEVSVADMKHLTRIGPSEYSYDLVHSKTNQAATARPENHKPVLGEAAAALNEWLAASKISEGRLFRRVLKGGHLGGPLSPAAVREIVRQRCHLAGVTGDFSAHSLRSGFVTESQAQGVGLADAMALTGHRSVATFLGYARASGGSRSAALRVLNGGDLTP